MRCTEFSSMREACAKNGLWSVQAPPSPPPHPPLPPPVCIARPHGDAVTLDPSGRWRPHDETSSSPRASLSIESRLKPSILREWGSWTTSAPAASASGRPGSPTSPASVRCAPSLSLISPAVFRAFFRVEIDAGFSEKKLYTRRATKKRKRKQAEC